MIQRFRAQDCMSLYNKEVQVEIRNVLFDRTTSGKREQVKRVMFANAKSDARSAWIASTKNLLFDKGGNASKLPQKSFNKLSRAEKAEVMNFPLTKIQLNQHVAAISQICNRDWLLFKLCRYGVNHTVKCLEHLQNIPIMAFA